MERPDRIEIKVPKKKTTYAKNILKEPIGFKYDN